MKQNPKFYLMKHGCSVFVGNIDFDIEEQQVVQELSAVGRVVSFRMVYDKVTGKSKGYGFCEYESPLVAETAMKTLKINFNGRPLKINYAENDIPTKAHEASTKPLQIEGIIATLDTFDDANLKDVIDYLKKMAVDQPSRLKELFDANPNLLVAVLTALLKLKLANEERVTRLVKESFDLPSLRDQIAARVKNVSEADLSKLTEDVRYRLSRMKNMLIKKEQAMQGNEQNM